MELNHTHRDDYTKTIHETKQDFDYQALVLQVNQTTILHCLGLVRLILLARLGEKSTTKQTNCVL
jgi:hypothetical protein